MVAIPAGDEHGQALPTIWTPPLGLEADSKEKKQIHFCVPFNLGKICRAFFVFSFSVPGDGLHSAGRGFGFDFLPFELVQFPVFFSKPRIFASFVAFFFVFLQTNYKDYTHHHFWNFCDSHVPQTEFDFLLPFYAVFFKFLLRPPPPQLTAWGEWPRGLAWQPAPALPSLELVRSVKQCVWPIHRGGGFFGWPNSHLTFSQCHRTSCAA